MRPEIYALSESNPWLDPTNTVALPPDIGNFMPTEAEETSFGFIEKSKNQHYSFINSILHLTKPS